MNNKPFFSIVIPVYNGLTHDLPKCLDSIWNQPLNKELYEVICIDDCSTDGTRAWLKEQQIIHNNLYIIENEVNIRQGGGRNKGVKVARGEYLLFIDQDDYYHEDGISQIYRHLKKNNLEILICDSAYQLKGYPNNNLQLNLPYTQITTGEDYIEQNGIVISPWRFCIKHEFYIQADCLFIENRRCEDADWCIRVLYHTKKIQYQPILLIHHIKTGSNETDSSFKSVEGLIDYINAGNVSMKIATDLYKNSKVKNIIEEFAEIYYYRSCAFLFVNFISISNKKRIIKEIQVKRCKNRLVNFAIKNPTLFAILTNCVVPIFLLAITIRRKRTANKLQQQ